jgi:hypothetical protein
MILEKFKNDFYIGSQSPLRIKVIVDKINQIIDYITGTTGSYREFSCTLSQEGTNNPSVNVLYNNIGFDVSVTRINVGVYGITISDEVSASKLYVVANTSGFGNGSLKVNINDEAGPGDPQILINTYSDYHVTLSDDHMAYVNLTFKVYN